MSAPKGAPPFSRRFLTGYHADISAASIIHIPIPCDGRIVQIDIAESAAISSATCNIVAKRIAGSAGGAGTAITGGAFALTVSGAAAGRLSSVIPTALHYVKAGDVLALDSDGASSTTCPAHYVVHLEPAS